MKLRRQHSVAGALRVFIRTSLFQPTPQHSNATMVDFAVSTADTCTLIGGALRTIEALYRDGYAYKKCGVMLCGLSPAGACKHRLFEPGNTRRREQLMQTLDAINRRFGRGAVHFAAVGFGKPWAMRCSRRTPAYTTRWGELVEVV